MRRLGASFAQMDAPELVDLPYVAGTAGTAEKWRISASRKRDE
jgi:hypothetical protein